MSTRPYLFYLPYHTNYTYHLAQILYYTGNGETPGFVDILSFCTVKLLSASHTRWAGYWLDLANWIPRDAYSAKYHMGGMPAGGVYSYSTLSISHSLSPVSILQSRGPPYLSAG